MKTLPTSVILHRIKQPLLAQTCWATAVSLLHFAFGGTWSMSVKVREGADRCPIFFLLKFPIREILFAHSKSMA